MTRLREKSASRSEEHEQIRLVPTPEPQVISEKMKSGSLTDPFFVVKNNASGNGCSNGALVDDMQSLSKEKHRDSKICNFHCSPVEWLTTLFPILLWLPKYDWKKDLPYDLVSGCTVCVMHIPQGMAYALLGGLQPVVGIYMAFFPVIVYSLMGTSRHISMGTFAVVCLMVGKVANERMSFYESESLNMNLTTSVTEQYLIDDDVMTGSPYTAEQVAAAISFVVGLWQILMGTLRLGSLSVLLSPELVSGFTTGAAVHVLTSQIKNLLGLSIPRRSGILKIPLTYADIFRNIGNSNMTAVIFSCVTISALAIFNEILKPIAARKIPMPIPVELITIVIGTLISRYWVTSEEYKFAIVKNIPTGLPAPILPPLEVTYDVVLDSLVIAIVAYTISISMAKIFAAKHGYPVGPNQELIANGTSNLVGSCFICAPIAASLSRSLIQEQVGGRTQIAGLFSSFLLLFVLLWIGPIFETLPHCVLSSIIVVSLKGMFLQFTDLLVAYKLSPLNAFVWFTTFSSTVLLDIEYGLGIGMACSVLTLLIRTTKSHMNVLDGNGGPDSKVNNVWSQVKGFTGVKVVKYTGGLNFATADTFAEKLHELVPPPSSDFLRKGLTDSTCASSMPKERTKDAVSVDQNDSDDFHTEIRTNIDDVSWIILDLSSLSSIDPSGVKILLEQYKLYNKNHVEILFCGCVSPVLKTMKRCGLMDAIGIEHFFPSMQDAISYLSKVASVPSVSTVTNNNDKEESLQSIGIICQPSMLPNVPKLVISRQ